MEQPSNTPVSEPVRLPEPVSGLPSPAQQSWGAVISIIIIVLMIIIGAFYAWGERIAQDGQIPGFPIEEEN